MSYPTGYDPRGLAPEIKIFPNNDLANPKFVWEHQQIFTAPRQDFTLEAWRISPGMSTNAGTAIIVIEDNDSTMTIDADSRIIRGDIIRIRLGKTFSGLEHWFSGTCQEPEVVRPGPNRQQIRIKIFGLANYLAHRLITINHQATKPLPTSAKVSEIAKKIITDDSLENFPSTGITLGTSGIEDIDIRLENFNHSNKSKKSVLDELATIAGSAYGVDPDLNVFMHRFDKDDGYLITNDLDTIYDNTKISFIRNRPYSWHPTTKTDYANTSIGYKTKKTTYAVNSQAMDRLIYTFWAAIKLDGISYDLTRIRLGLNVLNSIATPPGTIMFGFGSQIWKSDTELHEGITDSTTSTLPKLDIPRPTYDLIDEYGVNQWVELELDLDAWRAFYEPDKFYALMLRGAHGSENNPQRQVRFTAGTYSTTVYNGWARTNFSSGSNSNRQAQFAIQVIAESDHDIFIHNTTELNKRHQQERQHNYDGQDLEFAEALETKIMQSVGRIRRIYTPVTVSTPTTRPKLGKQVTFHDIKTGLQTYPVLLGYEITGNRSNRLAPYSMDVLLEEWL